MLDEDCLVTVLETPGDCTSEGAVVVQDVVVAGDEDDRAEGDALDADDLVVEDVLAG